MRPLRVLCVSPHFPPVNAADHQRLRMALPYLRQFGIEPVVLACDPESVEGAVLDPFLEQTYPSDIDIHRVRAIDYRSTRRFGFGSLAWRAMGAILSTGSRLIRERAFDLAFFSTTQFSTFLAGPYWRLRHGLRYVLDYQDPWRNRYYAEHGLVPPGGRVRFALAQSIAALSEAPVLAGASGVIRVSEAYRIDRNGLPVETIPFGAPRRDWEVVRQESRPGSRPEIVSVGRGGDDMAPALRVLFAGLAGMGSEAPRLRFVGTSYAPADRARETVRPIAEAFGVSQFVEEFATRIPYRDALKTQIEARAVVVLGSDDSRYTASKLRPALLTGRPVVVICHRESPMRTLAEENSAMVRCVHLDDPAAAASVAVALRWAVAADVSTAEPVGMLDAEAMTARLAEFLHRVAR